MYLIKFFSEKDQSCNFQLGIFGSILVDCVPVIRIHFWFVRIVVECKRKYIWFLVWNRIWTISWIIKISFTINTSHSRMRFTNNYRGHNFYCSYFIFWRILLSSLKQVNLLLIALLSVILFFRILKLDKTPPSFKFLLFFYLNQMYIHH